MAQTSSAAWAARVRLLSIIGAVLAVFSVLSGVVMLLMKWATGSAPDILSQIPLLVLPLAFIAFMVALWCAMKRRRAS